MKAAGRYANLSICSHILIHNRNAVVFVHFQASVTDSYTRACGCIYPDYDLAMEKIPDDVHFCGKIYPDNFTRTIEEITCAFQQHHLNVANCKPDCVNQKIIKTVASKQWPKRDKTLSFYNVFIKGTDKETHFKDTYEPIAELKRQGKSKEALRAVGETSLIQDNFVRLQVSYFQSGHVAIIDQAKYTTEGFISSLGGAFNLYAGISAVLIFEFLELILDMMFIKVYPPKRETKIESMKKEKVHFPESKFRY